LDSPNASELTNYLHDATGISVCARTIRSRMQEGGYYRRVATRKPFTSAINRAKRLAWAREHVGWSIDQWGKVIWSDESSFRYIFVRRRMIWRRNGERMKPENLQGTVKESKKKEMVWGCFSLGGMGT